MGNQYIPHISSLDLPGFFRVFFTAVSRPSWRECGAGSFTPHSALSTPRFRYAAIAPLAATVASSDSPPRSLALTPRYRTTYV